RSPRSRPAPSTGRWERRWPPARTGPPGRRKGSRTSWCASFFVVGRIAQNGLLPENQRLPQKDQGGGGGAECDEVGDGPDGYPEERRGIAILGDGERLGADAPRQQRHARRADRSDERVGQRADAPRQGLAQIIQLDV